MRYWLALTLGLCLTGMPVAAVQAQSGPVVEFTDASGRTATANARFLIWAKNVARQAAEVENGGLEVYRAEGAMHGPFIDTPFTIGDNGSLIFTFQGYRPWDINANGVADYTIESQVVVTPDRQFEIIYNGPMR